MRRLKVYTGIRPSRRPDGTVASNRDSHCISVADDRDAQTRVASPEGVWATPAKSASVLPHRIICATSFMQGVMKGTLGADVVQAIAKAKTDLRSNCLKEHQGNILIDPHGGRRGAKFFEAYVGGARNTDPLGKAGKRRLVLKV